MNQPKEIQSIYLTIETLLQNADARFKEAIAYADSPRDAELELSRMNTCLYGVMTELGRLRKHYEGRR